MTETIKGLPEKPKGKRHIGQKTIKTYQVPHNLMVIFIIVFVLVSIGSLAGIGYFAYQSGIWHEKYLTLESVILPKK
jgi:hypothetical protein